MKEFGFIFALICCACASPHTVEPARAPTVKPAPSALPELHPGDRLLAMKVRAVVERGDPRERAAVGAELTRLTREILSPAWVVNARPKVERANAAAGLTPTPEQLGAQIEAWRMELLTHVFDALQALRAPEHVALLFEIAADNAEPLGRRKLALRALDAMVAPQDAALVQKRQSLRNAVSAVEPAPDTGALADVSKHVAEMRAPFSLCYQEQLAREPDARYKGLLKFKIEPSGQTSTISTTDLPEGISSCIAAVVQATRFAPTAEPRTIQAPLNFVPTFPAPAPAPEAATAPSNACLSYEPNVVELTGTLERKDYPGLPNYESIEHGDARETTWLLRLDHLACTVEGASPSDPGRVGLSLMQLVLDGARDFDKYRPLMGKHIVARGTLFGAQTGHHHTDVLLTVSELKAAQ